MKQPVQHNPTSSVLGKSTFLLFKQEEYSVRHHALKKAPWAYNLSRHVASARGSVIKVQAKQTDYKGGHPSARALASQRHKSLFTVFSKIVRENTQKERKRSSSHPGAAPFLTRSHGSCSPLKSASQKHSSSTYPAARGALAIGRGDVIQQHILVSPGEAERKNNSLKLPNELTCEPYDCSRRIASAHTGLESPGTDADTSSLGKSAKRERSFPIGETLTVNNRQTHADGALKHRLCALLSRQKNARNV
ncbi:hypothetical protein DPX16_17872 [Anabarilius grahami]|uniref:Uncharacterized protein n=1 Tax=Anabarilius grahami TaxID=495550 RepID=A0A3N0YHC1_ANAGA|nr:hypothetical protein DPX16_17872 [Anabarilius grahami]